MGEEKLIKWRQWEDFEDRPAQRDFFLSAFDAVASSHAGRIHSRLLESRRNAFFNVLNLVTIKATRSRTLKDVFLSGDSFPTLAAREFV